MSTHINLEFHSKRHTYFDLRRIIKAQAQGFDEPVTGYLSGAFIQSSIATGVIFDHVRQDPSGRFGDGHLMQTSRVVAARREGRFWVLTTENSRYVIATFLKGVGRKSLRHHLRLLAKQSPIPLPTMH